MATSQDPLFEAVQKAVELVVQRGIEVRPMADGFYIRVASEEVAEQATQIPGRSW